MYIMSKYITIKRLIEHGDSYAIVIDKPFMDLLNITPDTPLKIITDGKGLILIPVDEKNLEEKVAEISERINKRHKTVFKNLSK